jgi:hypothetical protein
VVVMGAAGCAANVRKLCLIVFWPSARLNVRRIVQGRSAVRTVVEVCAGPVQRLLPTVSQRNVRLSAPPTVSLLSVATTVVEALAVTVGAVSSAILGSVTS